MVHRRAWPTVVFFFIEGVGTSNLARRLAAEGEGWSTCTKDPVAAAPPLHPLCAIPRAYSSARPAPRATPPACFVLGCTFLGASRRMGSPGCPTSSFTPRSSDAGEALLSPQRKASRRS